MDSGNLFAEDPDDVDRVGQQVVELLDLRRLVGHRARPLQLVRGDELKWKNYSCEEVEIWEKARNGSLKQAYVYPHSV